MVTLPLSSLARGTRLLLGNDRRNLVTKWADMLTKLFGFEEIILPSIEPLDVYTTKAGDEVLNQIYSFPDKADRQLCLRPEGTATCQLWADEQLKFKKDVQVWYEARCWRYEKPQLGRYREFTQIGVEILKPTKDYSEVLLNIATECLKITGIPIEVKPSISRGLAYYVGKGFEITCPLLGAQKQIVGGGSYKQGIGFAVGLDRVMLAMELMNARTTSLR